MRSCLLQGLLAVCLTLLQAVPANAGPCEDGATIYPQHRVATAREPLQELAAAGDACAAYQLGLMYSEGLGAARDPAEGARWFRVAADRGVADAQYSLGLSYELGRGVSVDYSEATRLYGLAAKQDHSAARLALQTLAQRLPPVSDPPANGTAERYGVFATVPGDPYALALDGEIGLDAPQEFHRALTKRPQTRLMVLNSNGGLVDPALVLAYEVRRLGISTYIPEHSSCYSSCSFIFLAGKQRAAKGELGVHQVWNDRHRAALANVLEALMEFGTDRAVISVMMRTPPDQVYVFNSHALTSFRINRGDPLAASGVMSEDLRGWAMAGNPLAQDSERGFLAERHK